MLARSASDRAPDLAAGLRPTFVVREEWFWPIALDAREGHFPDRAHESRYLRRTVRVLRPDRTTVEALTYVAIPSPDPGHPSRSYVKHLIDGAVHHGFPAAYVAGLKAIPTKHPTSG